MPLRGSCAHHIFWEQSHEWGDAIRKLSDHAQILKLFMFKG